jgi:hypothetical protein
MTHKRDYITVFIPQLLVRLALLATVDFYPDFVLHSLKEELDLVVQV